MTENIRSQTAAVIPAYQDEKHIGDIARRTRERLDYVLVVDDGSTDQTEQRAREAGAEVIVHTQNQGKGEAIKTGLARWLAANSPARSPAGRSGSTNYMGRPSRFCRPTSSRRDRSFFASGS